STLAARRGRDVVGIHRGGGRKRGPTVSTRTADLSRIARRTRRSGGARCAGDIDRGSQGLTRRETDEQQRRQQADADQPAHVPSLHRESDTSPVVMTKEIWWRRQADAPE